MQMMMLAATKGTELEITAEAKTDESVRRARKLVEGGFDED